MVERSLLDLGVDFSQVGAHDAQRGEDESSHEPYGEHQRCPAVNGGAGDEGVGHVDADAQGDDEEEQPDVEDGIEGLGSGDGSLTHFWLILQMLFIPFINKLNMRAKIRNLYHNCK